MGIRGGFMKSILVLLLSFSFSLTVFAEAPEHTVGEKLNSEVVGEVLLAIGKCDSGKTQFSDFSKVTLPLFTCEAYVEFVEYVVNPPGLFNKHRVRKEGSESEVKFRKVVKNQQLINYFTPSDDIFGHLQLSSNCETLRSNLERNLKYSDEEKEIIAGCFGL
jgi:hypothetical protein